MTNLEELFAVFNGKDIDGQFSVTLELIRKCRKEKFVDIDDDVKPLREWMKDLVEDQSPYRITYLSHSISLFPLQQAFRENKLNPFINVINQIKSEMMGCACAENFQTVKDLYVFWDDLSLTLQDINK